METKRLPINKTKISMKFATMDLGEAYHPDRNGSLASFTDNIHLAPVWLQTLKEKLKLWFRANRNFHFIGKQNFQHINFLNKKILEQAFTRVAEPSPVMLQNHKLILQPDKTPLPWQEAEELAKTGFWEFQVKSGKFSCTGNTLRLVNPQLQPEEISFNTLIAHFHEADKARLTENWDQLLGQARELDYNARITDLFGDKWIKIKAKAIWENSTVVKIIGYFQDITEAKVLEQLLYSARETAEQELKAKSDFLSVITHEIRTPLNSISGFTYLLLQEDVNREEQKEYLRSIQFSTQNLLALINKTLDYSKIEAGKLEFEHIPFQFHELLEDIHRSFYLRAAEKKVNLYLDISPATPDVAVGDPAKLCQILNNLISNAIKFTHEGHVKVSVEVVYESETDWVLEFTVSDTGVGIAEDKQPLVFESFTQASAATNRQFGGTGLGLAITKKLIELQHGSIQLHSIPGEGSEFTVRLKLAKPEANHIGMPRPEINLNLTQYVGLQGAKILVVDDNVLNRNVASKLLTNWQVKVDTAENGLEALKKVKTSPYDIILMDLFMPVMDGFNAIAQIKSYGIKTPIIALTGSALTEEENKMMDLGVHDYVTKPFNPQELYKTILEHLILVEI